MQRTRKRRPSADAVAKAAQSLDCSKSRCARLHARPHLSRIAPQDVSCHDDAAARRAAAWGLHVCVSGASCCAAERRQLSAQRRSAQAAQAMAQMSSAAATLP